MFRLTLSKILAKTAIITLHFKDYAVTINKLHYNLPQNQIITHFLC